MTKIRPAPQNFRLVGPRIYGQYQAMSIGAKTKAACLLPLVLCIAACGGGGGGSDSSSGSAAFVSIDASPSTIDSGDRIRVEVNLEAVNEDGIILKVRYPRDLEYVIDSSSLNSDGSDQDISPSFNESGPDGKNYLVYFLSQSRFSEDGSGKVSFQLKGVDAMTEGQIEVDPDIDDPLIANPGEFNIDEPEFNAEDAVTVRVRG